MRKYLKYNHLLANILIFANVALLSEVITDLIAEGYPVDPTAVAMLSPYITLHVIRFGRYAVDRTRRPQPLRYEVPLTDTSVEAAKEQVVVRAS